MLSSANMWLKRYPWLAHEGERLALNLGVEKEGLRVTHNGLISQRPHPSELGSKLTHPNITTDYSEALLEFITPVLSSSKAVLEVLDQLHRLTLDCIDQEWIWPTSMPCRIEHELDVPIADYGTSNTGLLKHVYRRGLWHRYGRIMQCIAGVHFNFSLSERFWQGITEDGIESADLTQIRTDHYFSTIRNFRRYSWLLMYLFGASPCVDASFLEAYPQKRHLLEKLDADTYFAPFATSLRMSGLGYQSDAQAGLFVCYNCLPTYLETLKQAIQTPYPPYEAFGLKNAEGQFNQMSTHILQIENEYYSDIRPKRSIVQPGEKPIHALASRGVEYIEVRSLDLNPYAPNGLSLTQMHFLELFMQFCTLKDSPLMDDAECRQAQKNVKTIVYEGRKPGLILHRAGRAVAMKDWAGQLLDEMFQLARCLDEQQGAGSYRQQALDNQRQLLSNVNNTLSARVVEDTTQAGSFQSFGIRQSQALASCFHTLTEPMREAFKATGKRSLQQQNALEAAPRIEFETFLRDYLADF